jgi:hypothetical protein
MDALAARAAQPGESVLLLGEPTVARTKNLTQKFYPARKHPANPVMRRTENGKASGPYLWGSRLMQDEKTGELRMWYIAYDYAGNFYRWGYATSKDALHWTKPDLGVEKFGDAPATNLLPLGRASRERAHAPSRAIRDRKRRPIGAISACGSLTTANSSPSRPMG